MLLTRHCPLRGGGGSIPSFPLRQILLGIGPNIQVLELFRSYHTGAEKPQLQIRPYDPGGVSDSR